MLALILAAPFILLVLVGFFAPIVRGLKTRQERDQQVEQELSDWRRGLH